jgi:hypothetical protein
MSPAGPAFVAAAIFCGSLLALPVSAAAIDPAGLFDTCFARNYSASQLSAHPGQRVRTMSVLFQSFEGDLLASVVYRVRFGTRFGFGGACSKAISGGFECDACVNNGCDQDGERFKILWSGGDTIRLVNDETGLLAKNAAGGRDYLMSGGEPREFVLSRAALTACAS